MFAKIYYWFHRLTSRAGERGQYSSGYWPDKVRAKALELCQGITGKLLEIGCGEGLFLIPVAEDNPNAEIWGIDNDLYRLKETSQKIVQKGIPRARLSLQKAGELSFKNECFDTVACINVFFNLDSLETVKQAVLQMKRVCKKSGRIIFDFRNCLNPLVVMKYRWARLYDKTVQRLPLNCYHPLDIEGMIRECGLLTTRRIYIGCRWLKSYAPIILVEAKNP